MARLTCWWCRSRRKPPVPPWGSGSSSAPAAWRRWAWRSRCRRDRTGPRWRAGAPPGGRTCRRLSYSYPGPGSSGEALSCSSPRSEAIPNLCSYQFRSFSFFFELPVGLKCFLLSAWLLTLKDDLNVNRRRKCSPSSYCLPALSSINVLWIWRKVSRIYFGRLWSSQES